MQVDDLILVSVDDHVVEPPDMFDGHIPAKWKDQAPKVVSVLDLASALPSPWRGFRGGGWQGGRGR